MSHPSVAGTLWRAWIVLLLAPVAWAAALGILFSLTNEACISRSRMEMALVAVASVLLAAAPGVIAWPWRRGLTRSTPEGERLRFMLGIAIGGSLLFTLLNLLTAAPVWLLDPCRT